MRQNKEVELHSEPTESDGALGRAAASQGFTLFEALIAMALTGLVLVILATVTGQWLPAWKAGFIRLQRADLLGLGIERITGDLGAAEFVSRNAATRRPYFEGDASSATFIRSALGPNASPGLEIVRIAEVPDQSGFALVRSHAPFDLFKSSNGDGKEPVFSDPIALLRAPFRVEFAYAGRDRNWRETWRNGGELPSFIRVTIKNIQTSEVSAASTIAMIHIGAPSACVRANTAYECIEELGRTGETKSDADSGQSIAEQPPPRGGRAIFER